MPVHTTDQDKTREQLLGELRAQRQLAQEQASKLRELLHLNTIIQTVNSTLNLDEVIEKVVVALEDIFSFNQISIYLYNAEHNTLEVSHWYGEGISEELMERFDNYPLSLDWDDVYFIKAFLDNEAQYVSPITPKLLRHYSPRDRQMFEWNPHKAIAIIPLQVQEKVIGLINFANTTAAFTLDDEQFARVQRYVGHIAATINNAYLVRKTRFALAQAQAKEQELAHINEVIQTTNATLDFDQMFAAIVRGLKTIVEFDGIGIQLVDQEQQLLNIYKVDSDIIAPHQLEQYHNIRITSTGCSSMSSQVFTSGLPAYFPTITADAPFGAIDRKIYAVHPFSAYLAYPLIVEGARIGVISFFWAHEHRPLNDHELSRIRRYVTALSTAIDKALRHQQLKDAHDLFAALLAASSSIQRQNSVEAVLQQTVTHLHRLFPALGFGVVLRKSAADQIDKAAFAGVAPATQAYLLAAPVEQLKALAVDPEMAPWFRLPTTMVPSEIHRCFLLPLADGSTDMGGFLMATGTYLGQDSREMIQRFMELVSAMITSKPLITDSTPP